MKKLIHRISSSGNKQILIATHSSLICSRLDLRNAILLSSNSNTPLPLKFLSEKTAKFFMKASNSAVLEYILSKKVMLIEGSSEYVLLEHFFEKKMKDSLENQDVHIISVNGTSFKRYLEIGKILKIKTAVVRDNDGNFEVVCNQRYKGYLSDNIKIFSEPDDDVCTFEVSIYKGNKEICDELFSKNKSNLSVLDYMLTNKVHCAFEILDKKGGEINTPTYINEAVEWISH